MIPTLNDAATLSETLQSLTSAAADGTVREVIVADGGSKDATISIANAMGCRVLQCEGERGERIAAGAKAARSDWLLFLCPDTVLEPTWRDAARTFMKERSDGAAAFRLALDEELGVSKMRAGLLTLRTVLSRTPCAEQGLLMARSTYEQVSGHSESMVSNHVDLVARLGRSRVSILPVRAVTRARRFSLDTAEATDA